MKYVIFGVVVAATSLTGCPAVDDLIKAPVEKVVSVQVEEALKPYATQIEKASATIKQQTQLIEDLKRGLADAQANFKRDMEVYSDISESYRDDYKTAAARMGADSTGYSVARTSLGPAVVKLAGISPYLDGYKIRLWITVLTPIDLSGLKGSVTWYEEDRAVLQKVNEKLRRKEFTSAAAFRSGRYTEVEFAVTPASATGLKHFAVVIETDQITVGYPPGVRQ